MDQLTEYCLISILSLIGLLIIGITSLNLYRKIRRCYPVYVNCWFCNTNSWVSYAKCNAWDCQSCEQYNGFAEDGDFNCDLPAQRDKSLNVSAGGFSKMVQRNVVQKKNGLCLACNRNQNLKIQQLAAFIPSSDEHYDREVEEYSLQLEKSYQLCLRCNYVLNRTLNKVKNNILGCKLAQIHAKGANNYGQNAGVGGKKRLTTSKFLQLAVCMKAGLAIILLFSLKVINEDSNVLSVFTFTISFLRHSMSTILHAIFLIVQRIFNNDLVTDILGQIQVQPTISLLTDSSITRQMIKLGFEVMNFVLVNSGLIVNLSGLLISLMIAVINYLHDIKDIMCLAVWSINLALPIIVKYLPIEDNTFGWAAALDMCKVLIVVTAVFEAFFNLRKFHAKPLICENINRSFHKIQWDDEEDNPEVSDGESELCHTESLMHQNSVQPHLSPSKAAFSPTLFRSPTVNVNETDYTGLLYKDIYHYPQANTPRSIFPMTCPTVYETSASFKPIQTPNTYYQVQPKSIPLIPQYNSCSIPGYETPDVFKSDGILTPSRLQFYQAPVSLTQASWVAGGYWNQTQSTSPKAASVEPQQIFPRIITSQLCPMSRTSSQSSGFESQSSSVTNHNHTLGGSSLCYQDVCALDNTPDQELGYSEPWLISGSTMKAGGVRKRVIPSTGNDRTFNLNLLSNNLPPLVKNCKLDKMEEWHIGDKLVTNFD